MVIISEIVMLYPKLQEFCVSLVLKKKNIYSVCLA